eukprot:3775726-Pyramimonas_sp.AAC.1
MAFRVANGLSASSSVRAPLIANPNPNPSPSPSPSPYPYPNPNPRCLPCGRGSRAAPPAPPAA